MPSSARFSIDDLLVAEGDLSPEYPLWLMLNLDELPDGQPRVADDFPLSADVHGVHEWRAVEH